MVNDAKDRPKSLQEWLDEVGRQRFQKENGKSTQLLTRALSDGRMPARWYMGVRQWCEANDIEVPDHLFKWDDPVPMDKQNAYSSDNIQEPIK